MEQNKMKAVICNRYGQPDVLQLTEVNKPVPKENEILIEIKASAVTASDIFIRSSNIPIQFKIPMRLMIGIRKSIIGLVFSGIVKSVGNKIKRFSPGEQVYGINEYKSRSEK